MANPQGVPGAVSPLEVTEAFGRRVAQERHNRGWSQQQLAEYVTAAGAPMHFTAISKLEAGLRRVQLPEAVAIAAVFGVPLTVLLTSGDPSETARQLEVAQASLAAAITTSDEAFADVAMWLNRTTDLRIALASEQAGAPATEEGQGDGPR